jgi:hypothetical protein
MCLYLKNKHNLVKKNKLLLYIKCLNFIGIALSCKYYDLIPVCLFNIPPGIGAIQFQAV